MAYHNPDIAGSTYETMEELEAAKKPAEKPKTEKPKEKAE